jgi:hypothetical protein
MRINLSKSGASISVGRRGAWLTSGPRGQRVTVGAPGTGLFLTQKLDSRRAQPNILARIFAWLVIAAIAAFSAIVIVMHAH